MPIYKVKATEWKPTPKIAPFRPTQIEVRDDGRATASDGTRKDTYSTLPELLEVFKLDGRPGGDLVPAPLE